LRDGNYITELLPDERANHLLFRARTACFRHFALRIFLRNTNKNSFIFIALNVAAVPKSGGGHALIANP
jgi:hypothetical protein